MDVSLERNFIKNNIESSVFDFHYENSGYTIALFGEKPMHFHVPFLKEYF